MRIAQVAPLFESVPPRLYGGTERVVSWLTEELVRQGHDVTLYASGDSQTSAELRSVCDAALRLDGDKHICPLAYHTLLAEVVAQESEEFDVVHFHIDVPCFPMMRRLSVPSVITLHGRLDIPDLYPLFREFNDLNLISISDSQRTPMPWASWVATVHHGLPESLYEPSFQSGKYLAFLGRISPEKRVDLAIDIAKRAGMRLRVSAKIDEADRAYFEEVRDRLKEPHVDFLGEIGEREKADLLSQAQALLFPIDWPEPFGLVMIEAMACGTPVIAFRRGSVPEIVEDGLTGYLVDSVDGAVEAVSRIPSLDRVACRAEFEKCFSARRMCRNYVRVYERIIAESKREDKGERGLTLIA